MFTEKNKIRQKQFDECYKEVYEMMAKYPHDPVPHNLAGILLEIQGQHNLAMKHFRAAWALDPSYEPANKNIDNFGDFIPKQAYVFV